MPELCRFLEATEPFEFPIGTDAEGQPIVLKMRAYVERIRETERDAKGKTKPSKWAELKKQETALIKEQADLAADVTKKAIALGELKVLDAAHFAEYEALLRGQIEEAQRQEDVAALHLLASSMAADLETFARSLLPDNPEIEARQKTFDEANEKAQERFAAMKPDFTRNYAERVAYLTQWWDLTVNGEMYPISTENVLAVLRPERIHEILVAFQKKAQG